MNVAIMVLIVMAGVGITFGFVLAVANKKFAVEVNPLIHVVEDALPKGQCGACGYAGCAAYAEAVVLDLEVAPNLCVPGKEAVAKVIADLTGKANTAVEPRIAHIKCKGSKNNAILSYHYTGVKDCIAANLLQGGPKGCKNGCIGFGTCVKNCPFGALSMSDEGLPVIDKNRCTGCGACEAVCPKKVIDMVSIHAITSIDCNSKEKGAVAKKMCSAACLGCGLCARNCTYKAIRIENNLAVVDAKICAEQCTEATCILKCPTKAIDLLISNEKQ